jgi:transglutaminase-like putative cysteine protease
VTYRIRVEHVSRYRYARVVHSSYNETRLTPLTTPSQLVLDSRVSVHPSSSLHGYVDYWGSVVHAFDLQQPHEEMVITGRSVVETSLGPSDSAAGRALTGRPAPGDLPLPGFEKAGGTAAAIGWAELADEATCDQFAEYLAPTAQVPYDERLAEVAAQLADTGGAGGAGPAEVAERAVQWVRDQLTYVPGTTQVHTSAVEAWQGGEGVCQDFAHLTLAVLRAMGIPARYCSGYVHPHGDAAVGETVRGESHAWIEYWSGAWTPVDPTAGRSIGEHHVLVARGRDYSDVPPVKGIFHGGPTSSLEVTVLLTRLA